LDIYVEECSVSWKSMIADWKITSQRAADNVSFLAI
jgi:hypothetical protein